MIHKIRYFETKTLSKGIYLQDAVNDFLAEKGENIIAVMPVMGNSLLVHYKEWFYLCLAFFSKMSIRLFTK